MHLLPKLLFSPYAEHMDSCKILLKKILNKLTLFFLSYPSTAAFLSFTTSHDTSISILSAWAER